MILLAWGKSHVQNIVMNIVIYEKINMLFGTSLRNGLLFPQN